MSIPDCAACGEPVLIVRRSNHPGYPYNEFYCTECRKYMGSEGVTHDFEGVGKQQELPLRRKDSEDYNRTKSHPKSKS